MTELQSLLKSWRPAGQVVTAIDLHTGGEPLRLITEGCPPLKGETILQKRRYLADKFDHIRTALMWEPRGHSDMYGCLLVEPELPSSDFGVLFMHNEGYSTMCGHGIIAVAVAVRKLIPSTQQMFGSTIKIDAPAGQIVVLNDGEVDGQATFLNVASFVVELDAEVDVEGFGTVTYDLAFGGAYYAYVDAASLNLQCEPANSNTLVAAANAIKKAINSSRTIVHPVHQDLGFLYGVIFVGPGGSETCHSRHVCVFADGEVDRSPTGTGVSARAAIMYERNALGVGESVTIDSITGSQFDVRVAALTSYAGHRAVIPEVTGSAFITGRHEFVINEDDPLASGFLLR